MLLSKVATMAANLVTIRPMKQIDRIAVLTLKVAKEQLPFVGHPIDILLQEKGVDFHVITKQEDANNIVGFFLTDEDVGRTYDFLTTDDEKASTIGLRKFLVDQNHQGKGYGGAAACQLRTYVHDNYPSYDNLLLTVNCRNEAAAGVYKNAGFRCGEEDLYLGGPVGPQYIMRLPLRL